MRLLFVIGAVLALQLPAHAQKVYAGVYGTETTFPFEIWSSDGLSLDGTQSDAGSDASVRCGTGAEATTTNDYTDEGTTYSIVLTATEMQCGSVLTVSVNETVDAVFFVQTLGNSSAMFTGIQQTGDAYARLGAPVGASISADLQVIDGNVDDIETDTGTTLQGELDGIQADTEDIQTRIPAALNNGVMPADVQRVNDVEITGDGSATPFNVP